MKFVILFEDNPNLGADVRREHMSAHLAFLEENAPSIKAAGPLMSPEGEAAGGIWLVDTKDARAAEALVEADPFWPTGLRKSFRVLQWTQVFASGKRLI
jgi:uncharacterized protein YciI